MCTSDSIRVGMLTSVRASAISASDVVNGVPACGLRMAVATSIPPGPGPIMPDRRWRGSRVGVELELDVVGIAEHQRRERDRFGDVPDPGVIDAQLVEPGDPTVELRP